MGTNVVIVGGGKNIGDIIKEIMSSGHPMPNVDLAGSHCLDPASVEAAMQRFDDYMHSDDACTCADEIDILYVYSMRDNGLVVSECIPGFDPDRGVPFIACLEDICSGEEVVDCEAIDLNLFEDMGAVIDNGEDVFMLSCCRCDDYAIERFKEYYADCEDSLSSCETVASRKDIVG